MTGEVFSTLSLLYDFRDLPGVRSTTHLLSMAFPRALRSGGWGSGVVEWRGRWGGGLCVWSSYPSIDPRPNCCSKTIQEPQLMLTLHTPYIHYFTLHSACVCFLWDTRLITCHQCFKNAESVWLFTSVTHIDPDYVRQRLEDGTQVLVVRPSPFLGAPSSKDSTAAAPRCAEWPQTGYQCCCVQLLWLHGSRHWGRGCPSPLLCDDVSLENLFAPRLLKMFH